MRHQKIDFFGRQGHGRFIELVNDLITRVSQKGLKRAFYRVMVGAADQPERQGATPCDRILSVKVQNPQFRMKLAAEPFLVQEDFMKADGQSLYGRSTKAFADRVGKAAFRKRNRRWPENGRMQVSVLAMQRAAEMTGRKDVIGQIGCVHCLEGFHQNIWNVRGNCAQYLRHGPGGMQEFVNVDMPKPVQLALALGVARVAGLPVLVLFMAPATHGPIPVGAAGGGYAGQFGDAFKGRIVRVVKIEPEA
ncbi:MAG: hypothetical protein QUV21_05030 [Tabrizicola sp.]|nr:hypothetical protein [Tabrizicola sp.]MDM7931257.1 hypothetical protein [Tabrizicola sp.]